ncbi:MAG TPA: efflux RND transporter periplasmic adaptor subunit [Methylomusa anaerophila]|uniref:Multidrug resistance protein MdtE n=1 Tax=Methylomusa anaerophila TaxID=1930071 RepID=A0A348AHX3_9FIRM|nr:efflux RND transporter periplasmic adaptor subunit [Methylomusa anaerophila]BBB90671.1 multidrug resistance protein MdtE precursor [Methylomusa anaerophila]HML88722.1 efflux RND transporter periplasmic adaptor subunit [Methylomusa anaerophila]
MRKPSTKKLYYIAAVIIILSAAAGMLWQHAARPQPVVQDAPQVRVAVIEPDSTSKFYSYAGEVRGRYESQLAFQVNGKIIKRNVDLGSPVNPGDVLMVIDPKDLTQAASSSSAQVYSTQSQLRLAASNLERYRQLYEQGAISRAQYDQYVTAYDSAAAAVQQASAQYAQTANQVDYSQLYADAAGVVSAISVEAGQVVSAGQTVVTVVRDGEREVEINVPENRLNELRQATQIKITFWALPDVSVDGSIREIAPMADKISRTYKVRISLLEPPPAMKLGMTASVAVAKSTPDSVSFYIPLTAVFQNGQTPSVWLVADNTVHLQPIKTGSFMDDKIEVSEGLQPGDIIVTAGVHKLREGQKVTVTGEKR